MKKCQKCGRYFDIDGQQCPVCHGRLMPAEQKPAQSENAAQKAVSNSYSKPSANPYAKPVKNPYGKPNLRQNPYAKPPQAKSFTPPEPDNKNAAPTHSNGAMGSLPPQPPVGTPPGTEPPQGNHKKEKKIILAVTAAVVAVSLVVTGTLSLFNRKPYMLSGKEAGNNSVALKENVQVLDSENAEKGLKEITFDDETSEYTLHYRNMPEEMKGLKQGDTFVMPSNVSSGKMQFNVGFSGKVSDAGSDFVRFTVPDFNQVFEKLKINASSASISNVNFVPEAGVSVDREEPLQPARIGNLQADTEKISFGNLSFDTTYVKPDKQSQLPGYEIIAKKLSLNINKKMKTEDENDIEVSGKLAFDYPAVKMNLDFDENTVNDYDVGFIADQSLKLKIKGSKEVNFLEPDLGLLDYSIIDIKDTYDEEPGKVVLGSYLVGMYLPLLENKHKIPIISIGFVFQICLTASGKITLECETSQSGFLQVETNSKKEGTCLYKNTNYPNPVLGETGEDGVDYDVIEMKTTAKGKVDFTAALSADVGFAILGTVPLKLSNDIPNFNLVTAFKTEEKSSKKFDVAKNLEPQKVENVSYYILSLKSTVRFCIGAEFNLLAIKVDAGKIFIEYKVWSHTLMQYPTPVDFTIKECDFGGIQLGQSYTKEEMDTAFYDSLKKADNYSLSGKMKDKTIQSVVDGIVDKFSVFEPGDILDVLELNGDYDIVCYSEGAIYLMQDGVVHAQLITGEKIYNRSYVSYTSSSDFFRMIYSDPGKQFKTEISIGELGKMLLKEMDMEAFAKYDGTDFEAYLYTNKNANMEVVFDGGGTPIYILTYLN